MLVGKNLCFNVAGMVEVLLHEAFTASKSGSCLAGSGVEELRDFLDGVGNFHTASTATKSGLNSNGAAILFSESNNLVGVFDGVLSAGCHRGVSALCNMAGGHLVTQITDSLWRWAYPDVAGINSCLRKISIFREEAIAGVNSVSPCGSCSLEELLHIEVGFSAGGSVQSDSLVSEGDERGISIGICIDGHTGDTSIAGTSDNADGDFAAVRNEYFLYCGCCGSGQYSLL